MILVFFSICLLCFLIGYLLAKHYEINNFINFLKQYNLLKYKKISNKELKDQYFKWEKEIGP